MSLNVYQLVILVSISGSVRECFFHTWKKVFRTDISKNAYEKFSPYSFKISSQLQWVIITLNAEFQFSACGVCSEAVPNESALLTQTSVWSLKLCALFHTVKNAKSFFIELLHKFSRTLNSCIKVIYCTFV